MIQSVVCAQRVESRKSPIPILGIRPGQEGTIAAVRGNRRVAQRLADLGLTPAATVRVLRIAPLGGPVELVVKGCKLAIGRDIARDVLITTEGN